MINTPAIQVGFTTIVIKTLSKSTRAAIYPRSSAATHTPLCVCVCICFTGKAQARRTAVDLSSSSLLLLQRKFATTCLIPATSIGIEDYRVPSAVPFTELQNNLPLPTPPPRRSHTNSRNFPSRVHYSHSHCSPGIIL